MTPPGHSSWSTWPMSNHRSHAGGRGQWVIRHMASTDIHSNRAATKDSLRFENRLKFSINPWKLSIFYRSFLNWSEASSHHHVPQRFNHPYSLLIQWSKWEKGGVGSHSVPFPYVNQQSWFWALFCCHQPLCVASQQSLIWAFYFHKWSNFSPPPPLPPQSNTAHHLQRSQIQAFLFANLPW